jgi:hypothetical protein
MRLAGDPIRASFTSSTTPPKRASSASLDRAFRDP